MEYKLPPIGSKGRYTLKAPLEDYLENRDGLECVGVVSFGDIVANGRDPFKTYYAPLGLSEQDYDQHTKTGAHIVSLRTDSGKFFRIPSPYIKEFPMVGGVPYLGMALVSALGALPVGMDLEFIRVAVDDTVKSLLGIEPDTDFAVITELSYVPQSRHEALEIAREAMVTDTVTDTARIKELTKLVEDLQSENNAMRQYIESEL